MFTFAKFCRLCFENNKSLVLFASKDSNNISYCDKTMKFMPELATGNVENYPIWICVTCCQELDHFYVFRKKCLQNYKVLQRYLKQLVSVKNTNTAINSHSFADDDDIKASSSSFQHSDECLSDTNISIVKNEISITEEDENDFKFIYKTLLQPETDATIIVDNVINNQDQTEEIQQQNILHKSSSSSNNKRRLSLNIETSLDAVKEELNESNILSEEIEHQYEEGDVRSSQNIELNLDNLNEPLKDSVLIDKTSWSIALKGQFEEEKNLEITSNSLDKTSNQSIINLEGPVQQVTDKSHNHPVQIKEEPIKINSKETDSGRTSSNSPRMSFRKRRFSTYLSPGSDYDDILEQEITETSQNIESNLDNTNESIRNTEVSEDISEPEVTKILQNKDTSKDVTTNQLVWLEKLKFKLDEKIKKTPETKIKKHAKKSKHVTKKLRETQVTDDTIETDDSDFEPELEFDNTYVFPSLKKIKYTYTNNKKFNSALNSKSPERKKHLGRTSSNISNSSDTDNLE